MADPATAYSGRILNEDALAEAPEGGEQAATPAAPLANEGAATPLSALGEEGAALPVGATGVQDDEARLKEVRERLKRTGGYNNSAVDAVFRAAAIFNAEAPDGRTVSELMLGLVWACEGHPRFLLHLKTAGPEDFYLRHYFAVTGYDAEADARRRAVKIAAIGVWNCGLDDIFILRGSEQTDPDAYKWDVALARWRRNLGRYAGWTKDVPFAGATPAELDLITFGEYDLAFDEDDAVGFLVAAASRFTKQLWELPAALEERGYRPALPPAHELADGDPVLAYATYQASATKAAAYFEVAVFARDFCEAVSESAVLSGQEVYLKPIIEALNRWLPKLKNELNRQDNVGLGWGVKTLLLNPEGVTALRAVTGKGWESIPAEENLSAEERRMLERVQRAWADYSLYVVAHFSHLPPGEFLGRGTLDGTARKLIRTDEAYGKGIQNMAERFIKVNPEAPLGRLRV